ncbi:pyridoxal phosphate-dependent aminotransferase [Bowmanella dokdonensis]|uniref:Aminotransferase class I/II-fold pyridoxal phosphate-dependent enzyme n=1 Tax=Bowmanella dokdonensis TaxID=751969 RepID=A0A939DRT6_9ALTE|nr:aminotransferase class I/II-fold pyridoxal phosphate-dependent enzyme [Bowmanella dokdonensis]MBN7827187.1 aminotransferase class I/II-fold pyridoxal phosphate-dependent enzyme [Bowmanella dokdonensis]
MKRVDSLTDRRRILKLLGTSVALTALGGWTPRLALADPDLPAFRTNADPLLLHYNENALGMSPKALQAAQQAALVLGNRYPDELLAQVKETLAQRLQVTTDHLILGNGSTEVLKALVRHLARQGASLLEPVPTFGLVSSYAATEGMPVIQVPVGQGFATDLAALRARAGQHQGRLLVNLCNPNNPTGTVLDSKMLLQWLAEAPDQHFFLLDEAYHDYAEGQGDYQSALALVKAGQPNLLVTRTFSKIYGMAGLRIGYGIATPGTARPIDQYSAGFNLNVTGLAAAAASLLDEQFYHYSRQSNQQARQILTSALARLELAYIPSYTNFVLHRINGPLVDYQQRMLQSGIKVGRRMTTEDGWNRLSLGTPEQMTEFVRVLEAFRGREWV